MKPNPCINPETQKPFDWENPNFIPGIHCTSCRYRELEEPRNPDFPYTCSPCIIKNKLYAWKKRSDAAKRAVQTKIKKYGKFSSRKK